MADTQIQRFNPVLRYDDGEKAMAFLEEAFGFDLDGNGAPIGVLRYRMLPYRSS